jgi:hypothetical protein
MSPRELYQQNVEAFNALDNKQRAAVVRGLVRLYAQDRQFQQRMADAIAEIGGTA